MKVFDTYPGGKGSDGTFQTLINLMPPHNVFISGYLGNCAVLRNKKPAPVNIGIDIDKAVCDRWKEVRGQVTTDIDIFNMPFLEYYREYGHHFNYPDTFIFLDPPFRMETRKSQDQVYNHEMTTPDHEKLLSTVLSMKANVMICSYQDDLYDSYLKHWDKQYYQDKTRKGPVMAVLYMNYQIEGKLHDYSFLGDDCTERQRIKRKIERHVSRLERLPIAERNAIIQQISEQFKVPG